MLRDYRVFLWSLKRRVVEVCAVLVPNCLFRHLLEFAAELSGDSHDSSDYVCVVGENLEIQRRSITCVFVSLIEDEDANDNDNRHVLFVLVLRWVSGVE